MENDNKEISKIKIDNNIYSIKDSYAREGLKELLGDDYDKDQEVELNNKKN